MVLVALTIVYKEAVALYVNLRVLRQRQIRPRERERNSRVPRNEPTAFFPVRQARPGDRGQLLHKLWGDCLAERYWMTEVRIANNKKLLLRQGSSALGQA